MSAAPPAPAPARGVGGMSDGQSRAVIVVVILVIGVALRLLLKSWPWPYIAASLALLGAGLAVAAEPWRAYGEAYQSWNEMNQPDKVSARRRYRVATAAALGLVLFSSLVPVLALPTPDTVVRAATIDNVAFTAPDGSARVDAPILKTVLTRIESLAVLNPGKRFIVYNCGVQRRKPHTIARRCECPQPYRAVPDSGGWNLNDHTAGSVIRLCSL